MSYIPKVGEECKWTIVDMSQIVTPLFVTEYNVVFAVNDIDYMRPLKEFSPLKTPAEIEREEFIKEVDRRLNCLGTDNDFIGLMYDAGYRKQQVNPLPEYYAINDLGLGIWQYRQLIKLGFIVQGGEL